MLDESEQEILFRILSRVPSDLIDMQEGSIISDVLSPTALELAQQRSMFKYMLGQAFAVDAEGEYLDKAASDYGIERAIGESDDALRLRVLYQKRNPERGGGDSDYERWALTVTGVQWVRAIDMARGLGTVDVVVAAQPDQLDQLVLACQLLIDMKKPSGVDARVRKVNVLQVGFSIQVTGITGALAMTVADAYLRSVGVGGTIVLSKLITTLINAGATDAIVTEPVQNIVLPVDSIIEPVVNIT